MKKFRKIEDEGYKKTQNQISVRIHEHKNSNE